MHSVRFITADKAVGAPGFQAVWTEVQDGASGAPCHHSYFRCARSQFCIPTDLKCDGTRNCGIHNGEPDTSDEDECKLDSFSNFQSVYTETKISKSSSNVQYYKKGPQHSFDFSLSTSLNL